MIMRPIFSRILKNGFAKRFLIPNQVNSCAQQKDSDGLCNFITRLYNTDQRYLSAFLSLNWYKRMPLIMGIQAANVENREYVYGPVPSRRLGRSLGVDLVPFKTCIYDCIYCQLHENAEIITDYSTVDAQENLSFRSEDVLVLLEHRPCSVEDIGNGLGLHPNEAIKYVEQLCSKGKIEPKFQNHRLYYVKKE